MWQGREITGETNWGCSVCSLLANSGVTVWPGGLILDPPVSPAPRNGHYKQWPCQSQQPWPICSEPERSFETWGFPFSSRGCVGKGLVVHPHTWLDMSPAWWAGSFNSRQVSNTVSERKKKTLWISLFCTMDSRFTDAKSASTLSFILSPVPWPS